MIDVKDIRPGNWFIYRSFEDCINDTGDFEDIYTQINADDMECFDENNKWAQKHRPIPLTPFFTEKFDKWFGNNVFEMRVNFDNTVSIYAWQSGVNIHIKNIAFLHEYQNFYRIITNEDLIVNLETEQPAL